VHSSPYPIFVDRGIARRTAYIILAIIVVGVVAGIAAFTLMPKQTPTAKVAGPLIVYTAIHEFEADRLLRAFTEETGIEAKYIRMSAGELVARIKAEAAAGKIEADVILGGPMIYHEELKKAGLLYKWDTPPENSKDIDPVFHDPDGYWFGFYVGAIAIAVNTEKLKELGLPEPTGWEDLVKPIYKGYIAIADPRTSGTAYTILVTLLSLYGEEKGWEYAEKLWKNAGVITKAGAAPAQLVGIGEYPIGIAFAHDILKVAAAGYPVKVIYPKEGTGWEIGPVSIVRNATHLEAAKIFVNWMLSRKAGQLHTDISMRLSTRPDVLPPPGTKPLTEINILRDFRWKWAVEHKDEILAKWENVVFGR